MSKTQDTPTSDIEVIDLSGDVDNPRTIIVKAFKPAQLEVFNPAPSLCDSRLAVVSSLYSTIRCLVSVFNFQIATINNLISNQTTLVKQLLEFDKNCKANTPLFYDLINNTLSTRFTYATCVVPSVRSVLTGVFNHFHNPIDSDVFIAKCSKIAGHLINVRLLSSVEIDTTSVEIQFLPRHALHVGYLQDQLTCVYGNILRLGTQASELVYHVKHTNTGSSLLDVVLRYWRELCGYVEMTEFAETAKITPRYGPSVGIENSRWPSTFKLSDCTVVCKKYSK